MIANVLTWLAIGVARPRRLAATGGALAIAGFAARFVISVSSWPTRASIPARPASPSLSR